jgi:hypothetical protein
MHVTQLELGLRLLQRRSQQFLYGDPGWLPPQLAPTAGVGPAQPQVPADPDSR